MPLITSAEAPTYSMHGASFTGLAAPARGATENAVWRVKLPAGTISASPHQLTREEILVVLAGAAEARIGAEIHRVASGDTIVIPAFTDFALDNIDAHDFEAIAVLPVGGRAMLPGRSPFTPPWAE